MKEDLLCLSAITANNLELGLFRYALTPEKKFTAVNSALFSMLGYSSRENFFKEKLDNLFVNSKDRYVFIEILQRGGNIKSFETPFKKKNGQTLWVALTVSCIFSTDNTICLEGIIQDISCWKENHDKLSMEKDFLENLLDNIPDAVYFKDRTNRIIKVNKFYIMGAGIKKEKIIGKTDFDFFPYEQAKEMFKDDNSILVTGKPVIGKIEKTLLPNGTYNQVITTKIPTYNKSGIITGTMGITRDMTNHANLEKQRLDMMMSSLKVLGQAMEMRDPYTSSHTRHVAIIAEEIAKDLNWSENNLLGIKLAGELHDLGKMSIPLDILNKPGKLSNLEYRLIQEHVKNCYDLIKNIDFPFPLAEMIYQHHERLDGSGYPRQLRDSGILPGARILAVSDVLEAMTYHRPYREALGIETACKELENGKGIKFDSKIVEIALKRVKDCGGKQFWLDN